MSLLRAHKPKHAKPSKAAPVLAVGGMTASFGAALTTSASAASDEDFARLRMCESGGNYSTNTGNGYYGAYQFDQRTWHGMGHSGLPSQASKGTQDQAAHDLQAARGWQPWPACARRLSPNISAWSPTSAAGMATAVRRFETPPFARALGLTFSTSMFGLHPVPKTPS